MKYRVILSPDANEHIRAVIRWYFDIQPQLSDRFQAETLAVLHRLAQNPYQFPQSHHPFRRALLNHFPYTVYFTLIAERVRVMAVIHQRRLRPWERV